MESKTNIELNRTLKTTFAICTFCIFALILAILIHLSFYLSPNAEDLRITYEMGSLKNPLITYYYSKDGRFFTNFLYRFGNPLLYNNIFLYKLLPIIFYFLWIFSSHQLIRLTSASKKLKLPLSVFLASIFVIFMPEISGGLFGMATLYNYGIMVFLIPLIISFYHQYINKQQQKYLLYTSLLLFLLAGTNVIGVFMVGLMLLGIIINGIIIPKKNIALLVTISSLILCAMIISIASPGNINRFGREKIQMPFIEHVFQIFKSFLNSFLAGTVKNIYIFSHPSLVIIMYFWFRYSKYLFKTSNTYFNSLKKTIPIYILLFITVSFVLPLPFYLSETWAWGHGTMYGVKNIDNPIFFILLLIHLFFINKISEFVDTPSKIEEIMNPKHTNIFLIIACILMLFTSETFFNNYIYDIDNKLLKKYNSENTTLHNHIKKQLSTQSTPIEINRIAHRPKTIFTYGYIMDGSLINVCEMNNNGYDVIGIDIDGDTIKSNSTFTKWIDRTKQFEYYFKHLNKDLLIPKKELKNCTFFLKKITPKISNIQSYFISNNHSSIIITNILIRYDFYLNKLNVHLFGFTFQKSGLNNYNFVVNINLHNQNDSLSNNFTINHPFAHSNMESITWEIDSNQRLTFYEASQKNQISVKINKIETSMNGKGYIHTIFLWEIK